MSVCEKPALLLQDIYLSDLFILRGPHQFLYSDYVTRYEDRGSHHLYIATMPTIMRVCPDWPGIDLTTLWKAVKHLHHCARPAQYLSEWKTWLIFKVLSDKHVQIHICIQEINPVFHHSATDGTVTSQGLTNFNNLRRKIKFSKISMTFGQIFHDFSRCTYFFPGLPVSVENLEIYTVLQIFSKA